MRRMLAPFLLLMLAACAAPGAATAPETASTATPVDAPARMQSGGVELDLSCKVDADCTVKDVGNCCGHYPRCVNKDSPTDPAGVQAQCRASGRMGVCGFREISACQCVEGRCAAQSTPLGRIVPGEPAP
ncbi:MAG: hypothetical protein QM761_04460 [Pseudoxanthomonas sp.]